MGYVERAHPIVITDEDVPDPMGEFLAGRGYAVELARERYGTQTPDYVIARDASELSAVVSTIRFGGLRVAQIHDAEVQRPLTSRGFLAN